MLIRTRTLNRTLAILELNGRLTAESGSALCDAVSAVLDEGRRFLIVNLAGVRAMDASGLGGLATTLRLVRQAGGALPAFESEADAIASFETAPV